MPPDDFVCWALDPARDVEERYLVELLVEEGVNNWYSRRKIYKHEAFEIFRERQRERQLNPAYQPAYSEENVRKALKHLSLKENFWQLNERPLRNLSAFRFLPELNSVTITRCEATDLSPLAELPKLKSLSIGAAGYNFGNSRCEDFRPLGRCRRLKSLSLGFNIHWPDLHGLDELSDLEELTLGGNLLALPSDICFPRVKIARLLCMPLAARNVSQLPALPACEFLTVRGVERLDGIEKMPRLRNFTLEGNVRDYGPLVGLKDLTWVTLGGESPYNVRPLNQLPKLKYLHFPVRSNHLYPAPPRDYTPLAEAPALRTLQVSSCPPVDVEVAAINAGLPPWDDQFLAAEARPVPSAVRMIVAPQQAQPRRDQPQLDGNELLVDKGIRDCEQKWVARFVVDYVARALDHGDWGSATVDGERRLISANVESFDVVERFSEIVDLIRQAMARLRGDYLCQLMITLRVRPPAPTPAQVELEEKFRDQQDQWDYEVSTRERAEYLERLHRYQLKKQEGEPIKPEEFSPSERPAPPWAKQEEENEEGDDGGGEGGVITKKKPDPPPSIYDDEHPLADQYLLLAHLTLDEIWFMPHHRDIAVYLTRREPDVEIPEEKETG